MVKCLYAVNQYMFFPLFDYTNAQRYYRFMGELIVTSQLQFQGYRRLRAGNRNRHLYNAKSALPDIRTQLPVVWASHQEVGLLISFAQSQMCRVCCDYIHVFINPPKAKLQKGNIIC